MSDNKSTPKRKGIGKALLCIILALVLAFGVLAGLYFWGRSQEAPASLTDSSPAAGTAVSMYEAQSLQSESAPPADETVPIAAAPKDYG